MAVINRAEFALNAPPVPSDFKIVQVQIVRDDGRGFKRIVWSDEPELDRIVRWRLAYADAMIKALTA